MPHTTVVGFVRVRGAREHNLKNVDVDIPRDALVAFTGVSGSGKSSLAFSTLYAEAQRRYLESVSPKVKDAIKNHRVLVGMNHEMVTFSKGRAPKKVRERDGDMEYEEWIYGEPPAAVDFIRFVSDEVVQVKTMKVDGQKIVRTEKEVDVQPPPSVAKGDQDQSHPANAPTLRRPGEEAPGVTPAGGVAPPPRPGAPTGTDPQGNPVPNWRSAP